MKISLNYFFLIFLILLYSCKEKTSNTVIKAKDKPVEIKKQDTTSVYLVSKPKKTITPKHDEYLFVNAKSGLNYRASPKGNVLGKYPLNTQLKVIEYTKITEQITDEEQTITGEWIGVEKGTDTVYVFNGFLSALPVVSDIKLYYASSYYKENNGDTRTGFLNVSETYFENAIIENNDRTETFILNKDNILKDTIKLNRSQRKKFLKSIKVSELDTVYIYEVGSDIIKTLSVKNLPAIACTNIYFSEGNYKKSEFDYEFGFDLGKTHGGGYNLVYIGTNNPFQTGKLKPMIWKEINNESFPKKFSTALINDSRKDWFDGFGPAESYTFSTKTLDYYIQNLAKNGIFRHRYIIVINPKTETIIFENVQINSESTYLVPLRTKNATDYSDNQWTGALLKNKPPVLFGFLNYSFGCPSITILDETEPAVPILCDNRH